MQPNAIVQTYKCCQYTKGKEFSRDACCSHPQYPQSTTQHYHRHKAEPRNDQQTKRSLPFLQGMLRPGDANIDKVTTAQKSVCYAPTPKLEVQNQQDDNKQVKSLPLLHRRRSVVQRGIGVPMLRKSKYYIVEYGYQNSPNRSQKVALT